MRIPKRIAIAISGAAFAGATTLFLGTAVQAGAQVAIAPHNGIAVAPQHTAAGHISTQIRTDDDDWGDEGYSCG
ncbi:hypothetical protein [Actinoallomurus sp. NPDC052274]|uniref:hypothetical protein n=1 Tax=Actinoallomurus sp. NPDC052274 TaxID=3155420 RepID=UPI0034348461